MLRQVYGGEMRITCFSLVKDHAAVVGRRVINPDHLDIPVVNTGIPVVNTGIPLSQNRIKTLVEVTLNAVRRNDDTDERGHYRPKTVRAMS